MQYRICSFNLYDLAYVCTRHTHTCILQCSHTSVGLAQAHPNEVLQTVGTWISAVITTVHKFFLSFRAYRIAGNFREHKFSRITDKHVRKKIRDFYFHDKVTISDHTPYNLPHGNGDPQRVFQRQNDSETLVRLSKHVGRCRRRTAMPEGGS